MAKSADGPWAPLCDELQASLIRLVMPEVRIGLQCLATCQIPTRFLLLNIFGGNWSALCLVAGQTLDVKTIHINNNNNNNNNNNDDIYIHICLPYE